MVTLDDGWLHGRFGSAVLEMLSDAGCAQPVIPPGIAGRFIEHVKREKLLEILALGEPDVARGTWEPLQSLRAPDTMPGPLLQDR